MAQAMRGTMEPTGLSRAGGLDPLVRISGDGRLEATLAQVMVGWGLGPAAAARPAGDASPDLRVEQGPDGWTCSGVAFDAPLTYRDPVAAACSLIAALYKAHTLVNREGFCLHAAGVRGSGGLALVTGHYRAGKSVVAAACAARGMQVFSDDIIPVGRDGRTARAPGLAVRLRLPLPATLADATRAFVEAHRVAASDRYLYIRPPSDLLAGHGEQAPIRAVISLARGEGSRARLSRLDPGEALGEAIRRNFAREMPAGAILDAFDRLVGEVPAMRLSYASAEDAAACIGDVLGGTAPWPVDGEAERAATAPAAPAQRVSTLPSEAVIRRDPGARLRERAGQAFLTDADERTIFGLNPTAAAVWRLLEGPAAFGELLAIFRAAFPDSDTDALSQDLSRLLRTLERRGFARIEPG